MSQEVYFIDVNVPMYAAGAAHANRAACVWVMTAVAQGDLQAAIDVEVIQEIYHRFGAQNRWDIANKMADNLLRLMPIVLPISLDDTLGMMAMGRRYGPSAGIRARDLLHAAVMHNNGLTNIISTDKHFDQIEGLRRLHPQEVMERWGSGAQ